VTAFWSIIVVVGIIAAIINFSLAVSRRNQMTVALVRGLAGVLSLAAAVGIVVGKAINVAHPPLEAKSVFIAFGVFTFIVLVAPTYLERNSKDPSKPTLQQRAARPANATIRLKNPGADEWVN
jgi:hypothetical protein